MGPRRAKATHPSEQRQPRRADDPAVDREPVEVRALEHAGEEDEAGVADGGGAQGAGDEDAEVGGVGEELAVELEDQRAEDGGDGQQEGVARGVEALDAAEQGDGDGHARA